jgi:hypothetical protein
MKGDIFKDPRTGTARNRGIVHGYQYVQNIPSGVSGTDSGVILALVALSGTGNTINVAPNTFKMTRKLIVHNTLAVSNQSGHITGKDIWGNDITESFALASGSRASVNAYNPAFPITVKIDSGVTHLSGQIGVSSAFGLERKVYSTDAKKSVIRCEVNGADESTDPTLTGASPNSGIGNFTFTTNTAHDTTKVTNIRYWAIQK